MKYLNKFENFSTHNYDLEVKSKGILNEPDGSSFETIVDNSKSKLLYDIEWEKELPKKISIDYHGKNYDFSLGNVMLLGDLVEVTYSSYPEEVWSKPDTLEFDFYFAKNTETDKIRINIDITYGDLMACEFSVESPNTVKVIQHTTYHSKFDPSNTVFALQDDSLNELIDFLNKFPKMKLNRKDFRFLDKYDNYHENNSNNISFITFDSN